MQRRTISKEHAVVFFDIDDTLVGHDSSQDLSSVIARSIPSPAVVQALHRLHENGHASFICTGRPLSLIPRPLLDLDCTGIVAASGAVVSIGGQIMSETILPPDLLQETVQHACDVGAVIVFEGSEASCTLVPRSRDYAGGMDIRVVHDFDELRKAFPAMKFCKFCFEKQELARLENDSEFFGRHYRRVNAGSRLDEMTMPSLDKGVGVARALELLGHGRKNTFAFGDSENDIAMLKAVETAVAMGNAMDSVKAVAAYVTDTVQQDGVATGLAHFGLA